MDIKINEEELDKLLDSLYNKNNKCFDKQKTAFLDGVDSLLHNDIIDSLLYNNEIYSKGFNDCLKRLDKKANLGVFKEEDKEADNE